MDPTLDSLAETPVFRLADRYIVESADLDPIWATGAGIGGHDDEMTDYSPEGIDGRAELARQALVDLAGAERSGPLEERAAAFMTERLATDLAMVDADESARQLNNIASPVQEIRQVFDLMPYGSEADWEVAARRLGRVPEAVTGLIASLRGRPEPRADGGAPPGVGGRAPGVELGRPGRLGPVLRRPRRPGRGRRCAPTLASELSPGRRVGHGRLRPARRLPAATSTRRPRPKPTPSAPSATSCSPAPSSGPTST